MMSFENHFLLEQIRVWRERRELEESVRGERRRAQERDKKNEGILTRLLVYFGCDFFSFAIVGI